MKLSISILFLVSALASSISQPSTTISTANGDLSIPGAVYKASYSGNIASGNVDLYTGAVGKRTYVMSSSVFNPTGGGANVIIKVKLSGTYYRLGNVAIAAGAGVSQPLVSAYFPFVLEAGDIIAINTDTATLNVSLKMIEYPASYRLYTPRLTAFINGANTLYTVPANSSANVFGISTLQQGGYVMYTNQTGGTISGLQLHSVPSGGTPGATNRTDGFNILDQHGAQWEFYQTMTAGDFIDITSTAATAGQFAWVTVAETTN